MKTFSVKILAFIIIAITLVSCVQSLPVSTEPPESTLVPTQTVVPAISDLIKQWINGEGCPLPCWDGITPGKTSFEEVVIQLSKATNVEITYTGDDIIEWKVTGSYYGRAFTGRENKTIALIYVVFLGEQNTYLKRAVDVYGYPTFVRSLCSEVLCDTDLIYPERGMAIMLSLGMQTGGYVNISNDSQIDRLLLFAPGLDNYKNIMPSRPDPIWQWEGYGLYSYEINTELTP